MIISCVFGGYRVLRNRPLYFRAMLSVLVKCGKDLVTSSWRLLFAVVPEVFGYN